MEEFIFTRAKQRSSAMWCCLSQTMLYALLLSLGTFEKNQTTTKKTTTARKLFTTFRNEFYL
jgi:hypothetical protein